MKITLLFFAVAFCLIGCNEYQNDPLEMRTVPVTNNPNLIGAPMQVDHSAIPY